MSTQELAFPAAEATIGSCSSVPKTGVRFLAMALWDVARFLCAIHCASGWADLAIRILEIHIFAVSLGSHTCWLLGRPDNPHLWWCSELLALGMHLGRAFLCLPPNGSHTNWRSGCPDSPLACNLSAPYWCISCIRSGCLGGAHAALSGNPAVLVHCCGLCAAVCVLGC